MRALYKSALLVGGLLLGSMAWAQKTQLQRHRGVKVGIGEDRVERRGQVTRGGGGAGEDARRLGQGDPGGREEQHSGTASRGWGTTGARGAQ